MYIFGRALHWLGMRESGHAGVDMIVSFDIAEEKFMKVLPLPIPPNYFLSAVLVLGISGF